MSRCPVCSSPMPDLPAPQPLTYCSQSCARKVEDAHRALLDAIATPEPDDEGDPTP